MGKPSGFKQDIANEICRRMAEGESLRQICRDEAMPNKAMVMRWLKNGKFPKFVEQYARAREQLLEYWADEIIDIADDASNDYMERTSRDGGTEIAYNAEHVQRSKLRIDARKWLLSKLVPKKYGDRIETTVKGDAEQPLVISRSDADL